MRRDFSTGSSFGSPYQDEEDADPRVGLVNLADVMLVFSCGLMLALVSYWNLDLPSVTELDRSDMQQVENVQEMTDAVQSSNSPYMELGKVYQDPKTGQLYVMTEEQDDEGSSEGTDEGVAASSEPSDNTGSSQDGSSDTQDGNVAAEKNSDTGNAS